MSERENNYKYAYNFMRTVLENKIDVVGYLDDDESIDIQKNLNELIVYNALDFLKDNFFNKYNEPNIVCHTVDDMEEHDNE